jgi:hypothetical protein
MSLVYGTFKAPIQHLHPVPVDEELAHGEEIDMKVTRINDSPIANTEKVAIPQSIPVLRAFSVSGMGQRCELFSPNIPFITPLARTGSQVPVFCCERVHPNRVTRCFQRKARRET